MIRAGNTGGVCGGPRRGGTVLVMVIALLTMLFLIATSFLFVVRFEREVAEDELAVAKQASTLVADPLLESLRLAIRRDAVGDDGTPFNYDLDEPIIPGNPDGARFVRSAVREEFGDAPGWRDLDGNEVLWVDGWGCADCRVNVVDREEVDGTSGATYDIGELGDGLWASSETFVISSEPNTLRWDRVSSFRDAKPRGPEVPGFVAGGGFVTESLSSGVVTLMNPDGNLNAQQDNQVETIRAVHATLTPDADGDGIPDFLFSPADDIDGSFTFPHPRTVLGAVDDPESVTAELPGQYRVMLRVVPHGGMVTLYNDNVSGFALPLHTPYSLIDAVAEGLDAQPGTLVVPNTVSPALDEPLLRRRNVLPPAAKAGTFASSVADPQGRWQNILLTPSAAAWRWYPLNFFDTTERNLFRSWNDATSTLSNELRYERRHLVTTISNDDVYRRRHPREASKVPAGLRQVMDLHGRTWGREGTMFRLTRLNEFNLQTHEQQMTELYAYFRALLAHTGLDASQQEEQAAMLAINTWDFYDSETNILGGVGQSPKGTHFPPGPSGNTFANVSGYGGRPLLGIEGLPFLSEVGVMFTLAANGDPTTDIVKHYYVEIFNPWPYFVYPNITIQVGGVVLGPGELALLQPAQVVGRVNPDNSNLLVIRTDATITVAPGAAVLDRPSLSFDTASPDVALVVSDAASGVEFWIDRIHDNGSGDWGGDAWIGSESELGWDQPEDEDRSYLESINRVLWTGDAGTRARRAWRFAIGGEQVISPGGSPGMENGVELSSDAAPVPLLFADRLEAGQAFPTTGSLLLVTRYAHIGRLAGGSGLPEPLSDLLWEPPYGGSRLAVDNGHMPLWGPAEQAGLSANYADVTGNGRGDLPWGQLVFDFFTALRNPADEVLQYADTGYTYPAVGEGGARVRGRINVNFAPWRVLAGVPMFPDTNTVVGPSLPVASLSGLRLRWKATGRDLFDPFGGALPVEVLSYESAARVAAYVLQRHVETGNFTGPLDLTREASRMVVPGSFFRRGPGVLTVGELANVFFPGIQYEQGSPNTTGALTMVSGGVEQPIDFLGGVKPLVQLGDWLTVKSNTFTIYATAVNLADPEDLVRMQWTVDRTRCLYSEELPEVIGEPVVVNYFDPARDPL